MAVERELQAPYFETFAGADDQRGVADTRPAAQQIGQGAAAFGIDGHGVQQAEDPAGTGVAGAGSGGLLDAAAAAFPLQLEGMGRIVTGEAGIDLVAAQEDRRPVRAERKRDADMKDGRIIPPSGSTLHSALPM